MVDLLKQVHFDEDVRVDGKVSPEDVPIPGLVRILHFPVELLCDLDDYRVLSHCVNAKILETLITIFLRVLNLSIRSTLGLRISTFSSSFSS